MKTPTNIICDLRTLFVLLDNLEKVKDRLVYEVTPEEFFELEKYFYKLGIRQLEMSAQDSMIILGFRVKKRVDV